MSAHEGSATSTGARRRGAPVRFVLLALLAYVVVGAVAGVVWEWVWTPPDQIVRDGQVFYTSYESLRRVFTGTGLYVLVGGVAAAATSLVICLLTRGRELVTLATVLIGSCAAAAVMRLVGPMLGPDDPLSAARPRGTQVVPGELTVNGFSPYLVWPMVSLFVLALVFFAWPTPHPSYAHDETPASGTRGAVPDGLPADRQRLVDQIQSARFTPVRIREGYELGAVDALLDRAVDAVTRGEPLGPVLDVPLPTVQWREGYDMGEVRSFLDGLRHLADGMEPRR
jgi:hypothetical protein